MKLRDYKHVLILIILMGVVIRSYLLLSWGPVFIDTDGVYYSRLGKNLVEYGSYQYGEDYNQGIIFPPLYPALIGLMNLLVGDLMLSGRIISFLAGVAAIPVFFLLGREVNGVESGLFSAFAYAVYPFIFRMSARVMSDSLFFFLFFSSVYVFILSSRRKDFYYTLLFGVSVSLAYLVRLEGVLLLSLPLFFAVDSEYRRTAYARKLVSVILVFALLSSPYVLFLWGSTGSFKLSGKSMFNMIIGEHVLGRDYEGIVGSLNQDRSLLNMYDSNSRDSVMGHVLNDPRSFTRKYASNFSRELLYIFLLLMPLYPLIIHDYFSKTPSNNYRRIFLILTGMLLVSYPVFLVQMRHVYTQVLCIILYLSANFVTLPDSVRRIFPPLAAYAKPVIILLLLSSCLSDAMVSMPYYPEEQVKAGLFLKSRSTGYESFNVMARKAFISYYSGSRITNFPYASVSDVLYFARKHGVDYLVVDERYMGSWSNYAELRDMGGHSSEVELVYNDSTIKDIRIYSLKD
ncbi:MAG: glycosyltransferase family 39 protein [Candidatus Altiarchaeota archaeon]